MKNTSQKVTVITFSDRAPLVLRGGQRAVKAALDDQLAARAERIYRAVPIK